MEAAVPPGSCFRRTGALGLAGMGMRYLGKPLMIVGVLAVVCSLLSYGASVTAKKPSSKTATHSASSSSHTTSHSTKSSKSKKSRKSKKARGQKAIDSTRTRQIQRALIEQHYLQGEPSGKWDDATQSALRKYQADHGWQSKTVPDSRALIKLGLGPSKEGLLNPETAMTSTAERQATSAKPSEPAPAGNIGPR
jgi:Putative peptidoglycan binding domain